jgi:ABC-type nitrate/sulfonate/bicarbonate transport system substrate-binding protein
MADEGPPCAHSLGDPFAFGTFALAGTFAERSPELASRLVAALDEAIAVVRANPGPARHAMVPFLREEERPYVDRYPDSRYEDARTAGSAWLSAEIERERQLGILDREPLVRAWQPTVTR